MSCAVFLIRRGKIRQKNASLALAIVYITFNVQEDKKSVPVAIITKVPLKFIKSKIDVLKAWYRITYKQLMKKIISIIS